MSRLVDGSMMTSVYRKPTHTDRYLSYNSDHPPHVKRGVIKSLLNRARDISAQSTLGIFLAFFDFVFCYLFSPEDGSNMAVKTCWLFQFFV